MKTLVNRYFKQDISFMGGMQAMKKIVLKSTVMALVAATLVGMAAAFAPVTVQAQSAPNFTGTLLRAEPNVRVNAFSAPGAAHTGWWFDYTSGDVRILGTRVHNGATWFNVRYPLFAGGTRDAWVPASSILHGNRAAQEVAFHRTTQVYRNSALRTRFGEVWSGQSRGYAWVIGARNGAYQVIYRLAAGGHRMGFVRPGTFSPVSEPPRAGFSPVWPTNGGWISQGDFNSRGQAHSRRHARAIDIAVPSGTPVFATEAGTVTAVRNLGNSSFGRYIEIRHDNGAFSLYAHLSQQSVHVNQRVNRGQRIGSSGNTGNSTGPHLHFELSNSTRNRMADFFPGR